MSETDPRVIEHLEAIRREMAVMMENIAALRTEFAEVRQMLADKVATRASEDAARAIASGASLH